MVRNVIAVGLLLALAPLSASAQDHPPQLVVNGLYTLPSDAKYQVVIINAPGGELHTNGHMLRVQGVGGLHCDGQLVIDGIGSKVVLSGGGTSIVNGVVSLEGTGPVFRIEQCSTSLEGLGWLVGMVPGRIEIATLQTLTNRITIIGRLNVMPSGLVGVATFRNEGTVLAGTVQFVALSFIDFWPGLVVTDSPSAVWEAQSFYGSLQFDTAAPLLTGEFRMMDLGVLNVNAIVATTGALNYNLGQINVSSLAVFTYGHDGCTSLHMAPPNPIIGPYSFNLLCP